VNALLWFLQGVMAFLTIPSGVMTLLVPSWEPVLPDEEPPPDFNLPLEVGRGMAAVVCGTLLIVPGLVGEATILTPIAAAALLVPAVGFPALRWKQGEIGPVHCFFGTIWLVWPPALVAWGRFGPYPL
jgi:hypothetical protein